jgi:predicted nucleotidyltransferase component of viral defense system
MVLSSYDIIYMGKKAEELGFVRDTLEKVTRLADILEYMNTNPILKESLALKGGTAINGMIDRYMISQGYSKNPRTKNPHSLDSWVYDYIGASGNRDNIKIEINYSLRSHVLLSQERPIITEHFSSEYSIKTLAPIEIYGSKINALLSRAAARDLYDARNMIHFGLFDESEENMLRKCIVFYAAISAKDINKTFDTKALDSITERKIKTDLLPVIKRRDGFELESAMRLVKKYIADLMVLKTEEKEFLNRFENGEYIPELLFEEQEILDRINEHPMAVWKTREGK